MIQNQLHNTRQLRTVSISCDLVVIGGGMAGVCCAITAARAGIRVTLVQDRPVLGGNASSEVRLWILGATSHMGNNNRWAREGGVIDEIMVENTYRNPEGNAVIFDTILLDKVTSEPNIRLLLNTAVYDLTKTDCDTIESVYAFCSQNSTTYNINAPYFCDASGDGIVGFMAGAAFRMGCESRDEFDEQLAPSEACSELLGHSLYFYTQDTGKAVRFTPPHFALMDIRAIPKWKTFNTKEQGCQLWWIEYGGRRDTVHDTEEIKWELWKIIYGVWNHIKNSGQFPEAETLTLQWVGTIPGKRESRRFEGDYILTQRDIVEQRRFDDAISYGGWAIDLHPADGVYSELPSCTQWHSKGIYQIPYRCLYSRNINNLFLAGRIISASHMAFGSTRVMVTCAHNGQAVGMAAALCLENRTQPRQLLETQRFSELQQRLIRTGHYIPHVAGHDPANLCEKADIHVSSQLTLQSLPADGPWLNLNCPRAMMLPVQPGRVPVISFHARTTETTTLEVQLRTSSTAGNFTPDRILATRHVQIEDGQVAHELLTARHQTLKTHAVQQSISNKTVPVAADVNQGGIGRTVNVDFGIDVHESQYLYVCILQNPHVSIRATEQRITGLLALNHGSNHRVSTSAVQSPPENSGIDTFEFWLPQRRPLGHNWAMTCDPPIDVFGPNHLRNGYTRPTTQPNAWVASFDDDSPTVTLQWKEPVQIQQIELFFDCDFDHPMESVLMGHPENVMPFCVQHIAIRDDVGRIIATVHNNHQTRVVIKLDQTITTQKLDIQLTHPSDGTPAAIFEIRCY